MRKNENTWFAHDCFDSQSPMMTMMCIKYKMQGYGMWWKLMEIFRTENDYRIKINEPFFYTALAIQMMCSEKKLHEYLADLVSYTLLQTDGEYLWCDGFLERMRFMEQKKEKLRAAGKKGGDTTKQNRLAAKGQTGSDTNSLPQQNSSDAAPPLQHFAAHNTTEHNITLQNITEHNTTEQNITTTEHNKTAQAQIIAVAVDSFKHPCSDENNLAVRTPPAGWALPDERYGANAATSANIGSHDVDIG